jgi:hypothetical protein
MTKPIVPDTHRYWFVRPADGEFDAYVCWPGEAPRYVGSRRRPTEAESAAYSAYCAEHRARQNVAARAVNWGS